MKTKSQMTIEELLLNESFLNYYFKKNEADIWEWEEYQETHFEQIETINEAIYTLDRLSLKWNEQQIRAKYQRLQKVFQTENKALGLHYSLKISLGIAASFLIMFGIWWTVALHSVSAIYKKQIAGKELIEKINNSNSPMQVRLPDGSIVSLQHDSRISYPIQFAVDSREVYLDGEAFFDITKNPQRPFMVYANDIITKVLGTRFWIRPEKKSKAIKVEVVSGKVSVYEQKPNLKTEKLTNSGNGVIVTPNQKVTFFDENSSFVKGLVEKPILLKIKTTETQALNFVYDDESLGQIIKDLQTAYAIEILVENDKIARCPLTANLNDLPFFTKLDLVCQSLHATYQVKGTTILISGKGCE